MLRSVLGEEAGAHGRGLEGAHGMAVAVGAADEAEGDFSGDGGATGGGHIGIAAMTAAGEWVALPTMAEEEKVQACGD